MSKKYLIKGGRVVDPANKISAVSDMFISDGKIEKIGKDLNVKSDESVNVYLAVKCKRSSVG